MRKFLTGLVLGAAIPAVCAYVAHQRAEDLEKEVTTEILSIESVVDDTEGMDRAFQKYQVAVKVWEAGGDYDLVQDAMLRNAKEYGAHAQSLNTSLQERTSALHDALGDNYQARAELLLGRLKEKGTKYAATPVEEGTKMLKRGE